jgi:hypothetical protein
MKLFVVSILNATTVDNTMYNMMCQKREQKKVGGGELRLAQLNINP